MDRDTDRREFMTTVAAGAAATGVGAGVASAQEGDEKRVQITMHDDEYVMAPHGLYVEPGETVVFETGVGAPHSSEAYEDRIPEDAEKWDSGIMDQGETFEHTFEVEGTYDYFCAPHKVLGQVGRIVVGEPGGPAEDSDIPDQPALGEIPSGDEIVERGRISVIEEEEESWLPFSVIGGGFSLVSLLVVAGVGTYVWKQEQGDNSAWSVGAASLAAGILLMIGVVLHLTGVL